MRSSKSMIFGAHCAISSTGGWSARKSPPSTVSSKCSHSLNPCCRAMSLQALIPPCAQTECDRFTGTIEKRSTLTPSSASLIVQARPANPPPTTMTRFFVAVAMTGLPHFLAHLGALLMDEVRVMVQMLDHVLNQIDPFHRAALAVNAGAIQRRARELAQHVAELLARQLDELARILGRLIFVSQRRRPLLLI